MPLAPIIIVEDDFDLSELLVRIIHRFKPGAHISSFHTAENALPKLRGSPVALLIVDCNLPGMSGITLIRQLRQEYACYPILLLTGHVDLLPAERVGVTRVLSKPFELATLRLLITELLPDGREHVSVGRGGTA